MSRRDGRAIHWAEAFGLSAAVHVGVVFFALDFINDIRFLPDPDDARADILITTLSFDEISVGAVPDAPNGTEEGLSAEDLTAAPADTLDPVDDNDTLTGSEPAVEELAPAEPEPLEPVAEDVVEDPPDLTPTPVDEITPDVADAVAPPTETLSAVDPADAPEALAPDALTQDSLAPDTLTPDALVPDALAPVAPAPLVAEPLSPLRPQNATTAASSAPAPERLTATAPSAAPAPTAPLAPVTATGIAPVAAVAPRVTRPPRPSPAVPTVAPPPPPPPGSPQAIVNELVAKIRTRVADPCLVATPQTAASGAPELAILSSSETAISDFATAVLADIAPPPGQRSILIDDRQCAALDYLRENPSYPGFRLTAGLVTDQLTGQANLQGAIGRAGGNYVSLLLVDDNGVVQVLNTYLSFAGGEARFDAPLRRDGNPRDTKQLLIAVASDTRPQTLDTQNGQEADVFFDALRAELGVNIPLVMLPFDLR